MLLDLYFTGVAGRSAGMTGDGAQDLHSTDSPGFTFMCFGSGNKSSLVAGKDRLSDFGYFGKKQKKYIS